MSKGFYLESQVELTEHEASQRERRAALSFAANFDPAPRRLTVESTQSSTAW